MGIKNIDISKVKVIAFDLDGTLTQHKSKLGDNSRNMLDDLAKKYKLLMVGAGACRRIFNQMDGYPIDIIGNYGLQCAVYNNETKDIDIVAEHILPCDKESVTARTEQIRKKYGYTEYRGDCVEFHASGAVTIPILGTNALIEDKLAFDPDRSKRRKIYKEVCELFPDYTVFVGGSSSFDMVPAPYNKYYALDNFCNENGLSHENIVYCGDDYGPGGNDEAVYLSDFPFVCVDDYTKVAEILSFLL